MQIDSARIGVDVSLDRLTLVLAVVSTTISVLLVITLLSDKPRPSHILALVPLTFLAAVTLSTAGAGSLEACFTWAALHGTVLGGSLLILRTAGLRFGGNAARGVVIDAGASHPHGRPSLLETNT